VKIIQQQLGHSSAETTFDIYAQVADDAQRKAICDLERLLVPNGPKFENSQMGGGFVN